MATKSKQTMVLVGDVFVDRDDPYSMFAPTRDTLQQADFTLGNLEAALSDRGIPITSKPMRELINFKSPPAVAGCLVEVGFDAVGIANNHSLDFGVDAYLDTIDALDRAGIAHTGGGRNLAEARKAAIVEKDGCRVALIGYTAVFHPGWEAGETNPGMATLAVHTSYEPSRRILEQPGTPPRVWTFMNPASKEQVLADVRRARAEADVVVMSFHWGVSMRHRLLADYQVELGRACIDAGADLVFGHHPHVLQGIEVYQGKPIFYSLSNFAFDLHMPEFFDDESILVRCEIVDRRIAEVSFVPLLINEAKQPEILDLDRGAYIVKMIADMSKPLGTTFTQRDGRVVVDGTFA